MREQDYKLPLTACERILEVLESDPDIEPFLDPVDYVEYPDYLEKIPYPMWLNEVKRRLESVIHPEKKEEGKTDKAEEEEEEEGDVKKEEKEKAEEKVKIEAMSPKPPSAPMVVNVGGSVVVPLAAQSGLVEEASYTSEAFVRDIRLIWSNCMTYNRRGTPIFKLAKNFSSQFEEMVQQSFERVNPPLMPKIERPTRLARSNRAASKTYAEDEFYDDWWDEDSEERAILEERQRDRMSTVDGDGAPKVDKILACRVAEKKEEKEGEKEGEKEEEGEKEKEEEEKEGKKDEEDENEEEEDEEEEEEEEAEGGEEGESKKKKKNTKKRKTEKVEKEYFVKWEGKSYLHCEWVPHSRIARHRQKLRRFENQQQQNAELGIEEPEELFDPRYCEIQRIIDYVKLEDGTEKFMCKWEELPYAEATWELRTDINDDKAIEEYFRWSKPPQPPPHRPLASAHENLAEGLEYNHGNQLRSYQLEGIVV